MVHQMQESFRQTVQLTGVSIGAVTFDGRDARTLVRYVRKTSKSRVTLPQCVSVGGSARTVA